MAKKKKKKISTVVTYRWDMAQLYEWDLRIQRLVALIPLYYKTAISQKRESECFRPHSNLYLLPGLLNPLLCLCVYAYMYTHTYSTNVLKLSMKIHKPEYICIYTMTFRLDVVCGSLLDFWNISIWSFQSPTPPIKPSLTNSK